MAKKTMSSVIDDVTLRLTGTSPMMMHNPQLIDPLNRYTAAISELVSKKAKITADEYQGQMAELEFAGGLYFDSEFGLFVPGYNVFCSIMEGGRFFNLGTAIAKAVLEYPEMVALEPHTEKYDDIAKMFADGHHLTKPVKIGKSRVLRTRPWFKTWTMSIPFQFDVSIVTKEDFIAAAETAGRLVGLGDGRKLGYGTGRYTVEVMR